MSATDRRNLERRIDALELLVRRITQLESKPRLIVGASGGSAGIEGTLDSYEVAGTDSPYNGLKVATITVKTAPCDRASLIDTQVEVVDHSECVFDLDEEDLVGVWVWASEKIALSLAADAEEGELTPCHWSADDRCCVAADSGA